MPYLYQLQDDAGFTHFKIENGGVTIPKPIRPTVESASATTSPTAADSGTYYRLSHASPVFNLPASAGCTVGVTVFWVQTIGTNNLGITANGSDDIEGMFYEEGDFTTLTGSETSSTSIERMALAELRYVASGKWAMIGAWGII